MKRTKLLLLILAILMPMMANADPVEIDGIYYNLISKTKTAEVTSNPNKYSGEVTIPNKVVYEEEEYSVTSIGKEAFYFCSQLTSASIPNGVTSIGEHAFAYCSSLASVTIPNSMISIGFGAFQSCSSLTSVTIPNSVTALGSSAFSSCTALTSVIIPNSVTTIYTFTFKNCSSLTSVTIPNSVTTILDGNFEGCSSLPSITIPNGVTYIGTHAFEGCICLSSISIPNSVTEIDSWAFQGCTNLTSITIGSGVTNLNTKAFAQCPNLSDVYCYAKNVPNQYSVFEGSYIDYATLHVPNGNVDAYKAVEPWKNFKSIVAIGTPKHTLTYIVDGEEYKKIEIYEGESITPEAAPTKEGYTFSGWSEIPETMPAKDVTVTGTFSYGVKIDNIWYNIIEKGGVASVTHGNWNTSYYYNDDRYAGDIIIPQEITYNEKVYPVVSIGSNAFSNCRNLTSIVIPNSVTSIENYAFSYCSGLTSVSISSNLTSIGNSAFEYCTGLTSVILPNSVTSLGSQAFGGCKGLTSINIPNSVTSINAFSGCSSLTSISIPNSVTSIGEYNQEIKGETNVEIISVIA